MHSILIVDDLESIHEMLEAVIQPIGYETAFATDGEMALQKIREQHFDIILTDINMQPMDGIQLLAQIKEADPEAIVIMMSGYANIENATNSLKYGAFDFLTKPFKVDQLMNAITRATAAREKKAAPNDSSQAQSSILLSGDSDAARALNDRFHRAAKLAAPLLIVGDAGGQKTKIARAIHAESEFASGPIVTIDAREVDQTELANLFFSDDEFTEPSETVASAHTGSLHIANIDRIPRPLQNSIGNLIRDLKGDCRVICTSSSDIEQLVEEGQFEDALYFRIANNAMLIPSLRDRSEDIPALARTFFAQNNLPDINISEGATAILQGYRWPGNYTEFEEVLDAAATTREGNTIRESDLPEKLQDISSWPNLAAYLEEQAERYKQAVIRAAQGDRERATEILGIAPDEL
ncbi:sigma-54-dependent transcriptional regulator [Pelagicoccus albus]|uniref:Sigma-54-dependent Fis family transcriptional regulator n=1 Tax=Pelagicoccus albus TaxID=415222 RepID=A0A7X1E8V6_9BACT|nr:response regulator [Pelagicoccus albus]MBC2607160.1 sigma-54-dependent Fis family transcriptional regulator [Pelagicoccus albus]